jgi:HK97 family phage portal protein
MSFFTDVLGGRLRADVDNLQRDASDNSFFYPHAQRSEINVDVSIARARQIPVVRDCLKTLADSVAGLQFGVFERKNATTVNQIDSHPISKLFERPNRMMTGFEFVYTLVDDLCTAGDFYAEKIYQNGQLVELRRIDPETVAVEISEGYLKRFTYTDPFGVQQVKLDEEVWHVPMPPMRHCAKGTSPILEDGREAIAVAIALQRYSNILFANDATPTYVWTMEGNFKDEASKTNWLSAMMKWSSGRNRHRPAVVEHGVKPHRMGLDAEEAQFIETRKELWLDLCRLWRVPPHKVGILDRATFSNIEHQSLEFVIDTLRPILELIERSVNVYLLEEDDQYFEFNVKSLLRGDIKTRYEAYALGRQWGWLSVNDILNAENSNGIGRAGDRYIEPMNMVPVGVGDNERNPESQKGVAKSISFLRQSVNQNGGKPRLELIKDAA